MAAATSAHADTGYRDRDPPPSFDGREEMFRQYNRELELWRHETDVPKVKQGAKVLRHLPGSAKAVVDELSIAEITSEQGVDKILAALKVYFQPHLETAVPRALEKAVYAESRKGKESLGDYIIRMEAAFRELSTEGIKLEDQVRGYIIFRHAALTQVQEDQVTTWTQGKFGGDDIVRAMRKLEKLQKERGSAKIYPAEGEILAELPEEEDDSEDYVHLGEKDLEEIFDEEEITEALASYQQVRKAIRDQKTSRGYYDGKSHGKSSATSKGGGSARLNFSAGGGRVQFRGSSERGTMVHVDMLKLRTRCAKCGIIGHGQRSAPMSQMPVGVSVRQ